MRRKPAESSFDAVRDTAQRQAPDLVEQYRALWDDLWAARGTVSIAQIEEVRAVVFGFLADAVPAATARMVTTEFMKGLAR